MNILVPNLGSTSLKYQILDMPAERVLSRGRLERVKDYREAVAQVRAGDSRIDAVAFKAVHAGAKYRGTFVVDDELLVAMEEFLPAAPVHNAIYLTAMRAFQSEIPGVPLVAAFETEFHATMPEYAARYGVPCEWREQYGVRKYGFHGASHRYIGERAAELLGQPQASLRLVSCHLGGSSSICAIDGGRSVDTTMGFTPLEGLLMGTRAGDLDAAILPWVMTMEDVTLSQLNAMLNKHSGLYGISGVSSDMREIEHACATGNKRARLAFDIFCNRIRKYVGAYAAAMGGIEAVTFTGGIGENSALVRETAMAGMEFLGIELDGEANRAAPRGKELLVSKPGSKVAVALIPTNEERVIARDTVRVLGGVMPSFAVPGTEAPR